MRKPFLISCSYMTGALLATEGAGAEVSGLVAVEDHAHVFQSDHFAAGFGAKHLDTVLVTEVVAALYGVVGMVFPGVVNIDGGVDTALRRVRVAAHRVHLGDDRDVYAFGLRSETCAHTGETGANDQDIVLKDGHQADLRDSPSLEGLWTAAKIVVSGLGLPRRNLDVNAAPRYGQQSTPPPANTLQHPR
jgi:hypothetical protein